METFLINLLFSWPGISARLLRIATGFLVLFVVPVWYIALPLMRVIGFSSIQSSLDACDEVLVPHWSLKSVYSEGVTTPSVFDAAANRFY